MLVEKFNNSIFNSNTYIIHSKNEIKTWVIDPGDSQPITGWLEKNNKYLDGILVTHAHFDHIYGINDLYDFNPKVKIYSSNFAKEGMLSAKINRSYYTENPFIVKSDNINIVEDNDLIQIFKTIKVKVLYTPGHNNDCLSFKINKYLFTGDALIPGIKVHTKSKHSDKHKANASINRMLNNFDDNTIICPGHGDMTLLKNIKVIDVIRFNI